MTGSLSILGLEGAFDVPDRMTMSNYVDAFTKNDPGRIFTLNDAAISKYARGEERDRRWIQEGVVAGVVSLPVVRMRFNTARYDSPEEQRNAERLLAEDEAWFETIKRVRSKTAAPGRR